MSTHRAIATTAKGKIEELQVKTDTPEANQVLIKVEYSALNAIDSYFTDRGFYITELPYILGMTGAGTISKVGSGVEDLKVGDRVTSFAYGESRNRGLQEYVVQPRSLVTKVPDTLPLDAAATLSNGFVCAFYSLFDQLGLPIPTSLPAKSPPPLADTPILIYGASSSTAGFAIPLLSLAGYKNIIATASERNHERVLSLGATHVFDYKSPTLAEDIAAVVGGDGKVPYALDCITAESTLDIIAKIISPCGKVALLLPIKEGGSVTGTLEEELYFEVKADKNPFPPTVELLYVRTFLFLQNEYLKDNLMPKILPELLEAGHIQPLRVRLMNKGTLKERAEEGLDLIRNNKVSNQRVVVKLAD